MGKKRKSARPAVATPPPARARIAEPKPKTPPVAPPPAPVFWFGFEISWAKLAVARVVIFALLAIDAVLQIGHAPRYGAGDFNVANLALFEAIAPGRIGFELGQLACAYVFVLAACGVALRVVVPIGAAIYAWLYFGSQLDSYQHHYLVALLLLLFCFVPWQRPDGVTPRTRVRSWAVRLVLVQLAIVYFWAAISKMHPAWLDGTTLGKQLAGWTRGLVANAALPPLSKLVIAVELALAATIWTRYARTSVALVGIAFHIGIAMTGLEIGLFAYLMMGLYLLIVPDRLFVAVAESSLGTRVRATLQRAGERRALLVFGGILAVSIPLALATRLPTSLVFGLVLIVVPIALWLRGPRRATIAIAHALALFTWVAVDRLGDVATDYYRFWGGSQRRLGDLATAERAYRGLAAIDDSGNAQYQLGRMLLTDLKRETEALALLHAAQQLETTRARSWVAEARWLAGRGQKAEAIAKLRRAVEVEPRHSEARAMLRELLERGTASTPDTDAP